ncbi:MAG: flagellar motor switch protein FliM [Limimaricola sp.]|uniref:FliM/FliN family flagellar motor switch protein n=1 Tax=Limimaricola sp. TaxID=2211665 RepID=UPI001D22E0BB|nr:flagellar motor switch protein FliM [Limimaricola sp.]MBI1416501.1 flagellar motor switch protein FliM [Limimaricola sp.]
MVQAESVLRRKLGGGVAAAELALQASASRALRLALSRAFEAVCGIGISVLGVGDDVAPLEDLCQRLDAVPLLLALTAGQGPQGAVGLDAEARSAIVEAMTTGRVTPAAAEERAVTATDAALCTPLLARFVAGLRETAKGSVLARQAAGLKVQGKFASARTMGLDLPDHAFRLCRLTLDFGAGGRQGEVVLALPALEETAAQKGTAIASEPGDAWATQLTAAVMAAPAHLVAELHRMRLPLAAVQGLQPGQVLPLPGTSVASVRLCGPDGGVVARARLGQVSGQRAVRIEAPKPPELNEALGAPPLAGPQNALGSA